MKERRGYFSMTEMEDLLEKVKKAEDRDMWYAAARIYVELATKTSDTEGEVTVSNWGTAVAILIVDGGSAGSAMVRAMQGTEQVGEDEKIIRDDVTVVLNDRLTYNGVEFRVVGVRSERVESTDIIKIIRVAEVTDTSLW